jgi:hypothetical protein
VAFRKWPHTAAAATTGDCEHTAASKAEVMSKLDLTAPATEFEIDIARRDVATVQEETRAQSGAERSEATVEEIRERAKGAKRR